MTTFAPVPMDVLRSMSGLDVLHAMLAGQLPAPPISRMMQFMLADVGKGRAVFSCTPTLEHYNPTGSVHGGLAGALLDSCMGCAVMTTLPKGFASTTLEYRVHLVRAMSDKTGPVRAEGTVVHAGRQVATAEGRIVDAAGKLYAHGTTTCLVFAL